MGVTKSDPNAHVSYICVGGGGECVESLCSACHGQVPPIQKFTTAERVAHFSRHFSTIELRIGEGQEIPFAGAKVLRERARLVLVDGRGIKREFPVGALLLGNKTGMPLGIAYSGSAPPPAR
jgi:hypothetical protein